jgi:hypothetical protein
VDALIITFVKTVSRKNKRDQVRGIKNPDYGLAARATRARILARVLATFRERPRSRRSTMGCMKPYTNPITFTNSAKASMSSDGSVWHSGNCFSLSTMAGPWREAPTLFKSLP